MKIIGDTGRPTLWAGRVVELPDDEAKALVEEGYAIPFIDHCAAAEHR